MLEKAFEPLHVIFAWLHGLCNLSQVHLGTGCKLVQIVLLPLSTEAQQSFKLGRLLLLLRSLSWSPFISSVMKGVSIEHPWRIATATFKVHSGRLTLVPPILLTFPVQEAEAVAYPVLEGEEAAEPATVH